MHCNIKSLQKEKYQLVAMLGSGGFANTYLAIQSGLERKVAIKEFFMKEYCDRNESTSQVIVPTEGSRLIVNRYKQKFLKEAQMIASLKNEHIIKIYDIFEENNTAYYVMEYVEGGSLKDKVERDGALTEHVATKYICQIAEALSYLHAKNILHLDIKPANVLLDKDDTVILIDFGISKHYDSEGGQTSTTPTGISKGYAPIEQYQQGSIANFSPATDVYSLGATLLYLLTGQTPPEASVVYEDGLPSIIDNFSESIRNVVKTAMYPRRKDRFQNVEGFLEGLTDVSKIDSSMTQKSKFDKSAEIDEETTVLGDTYSEAKLDNQDGNEDKCGCTKDYDVPNENADKIEGWMAFFLWTGIGFGVIVSIFYYSYSLFYPLFLILIIIGVKTIWAFYKRKENAVPLAITYCVVLGMDACSLVISNLFMNDPELWIQAFQKVVWYGITSVLFMILYCSDRVECRFPKANRKWHNFEKITLWTLGISYFLSIMLGGWWS